MFLDVNLRMVDGVMIVDLIGELSRRGPSLNNPMKELLELGRSSLVLNLSGLAYVDSSGLGEMIALWTSIANRGGQLILLRPTPQVYAQLQMTKLDTVFTITQNEEEAVRRIQKVVAARMHPAT
jgi:anti-sigma B factor antagonist